MGEAAQSVKFFAFQIHHVFVSKQRAAAKDTTVNHEC